jgi:signal transduction histidine kinase/CheY-like chemotaxis protein
MTIGVLVVVFFATLASFGAAQRVVDDNETRLLSDRAQDVRGLLESIGTTYEAQMASVGAIAQVTGGDAEQFRIAVNAVDPQAGASEHAGWSLLRRTPTGFEEIGRIGQPTPVGQLPKEWSTALDGAAGGRFSVLGFLGAGLDRRFAMATGRQGLPGDLVVYNETSLLGATASAAGGGGSDAVSGLSVALYVGSEPREDTKLFAFGDLTGRIERELVDIAGTKVLLQVGATGPLAGGLSTNFPRILLGAGALLCIALGSLVEIVLRRRDDALATVADLEAKNVQLDQALEEQRAAEEARAALEAELRQSHHLEAVGHLAGGVAHDFNNLLAAIISYADLAGDGITDEQARSDLEEIRNAARRGAALTGQLLQFSRRQALEPVLIDANEHVRDLTRLLHRTLGEDVQLHTSLTEERTTVRADPHELDQVLLNLVVNARDALRPGGSIVVETDRVEVDERLAGQYTGLLPGPHVRIVVRDDGRGIDPEVIDHVFEPFFTTKGRGQGTGLGLATVYGIVQRHHGHVAVRSQPGEGTEIEVLLPAADGTPQAPPVAVPAETNGHQPDRTVLLVEDEAAVRRAIRRMLERSGYRVLEAEDGNEALASYGSEPIDLLLTDLVMPGGMTGVDVARRLREGAADLPVLYITGYGAEVLDERGLATQAGASLLAKPFSEDDLLGAVRTAMGAS